MINYNLKSSVLAACALAIAGLSPAAAGTYTVIYNMSQYSSPATLVEGSPGVFYTSVDPPPGVVSVTKQGVLKALAMFQDPPNVIESAWSLQRTASSTPDSRSSPLGKCSPFHPPREASTPTRSRAL